MDYLVRGAKTYLLKTTIGRQGRIEAVVSDILTEGLIRQMQAEMWGMNCQAHQDSVQLPRAYERCVMIKT